MHVDPEGSGITCYGHRLPGDLSNSAKHQQEREKTIVALNAGRIAQVRVFPECPDANWAGDVDVVGALLDEMFTTNPNARSAAAESLQQQAEDLVRRHWRPIHGLATELLSKPWTDQPPIEIKENWSRGKTTLERWVPGSEVVRLLSSFGIAAELRDV
jgi:hypothetical protein